MGLMQQGGWDMWLLLLISIVGLAVVIERLVFFQTQHSDTKGLLRQIGAKVSADDLDGAIEICKKNRGMLPRILEFGLRRGEKNRADISDALKKIVATTFKNFGIAIYSRPEARPGGELGNVYMDAPSVHVIDHTIYHTDLDVPLLVPEPSYSSGDDYVVEFLGFRFSFNAYDFEQRVTAADQRCFDCGARRRVAVLRRAVGLRGMLLAATLEELNRALVLLRLRELGQTSATPGRRSRDQMTHPPARWIPRGPREFRWRRRIPSPGATPHQADSAIDRPPCTMRRASPLRSRNIPFRCRHRRPAMPVSSRSRC